MLSRIGPGTVCRPSRVESVRPRSGSGVLAAGLGEGKWEMQVAGTTLQFRRMCSSGHPRCSVVTTGTGLHRALELF